MCARSRISVFSFLITVMAVAWSPLARSADAVLVQSGTKSKASRLYEQAIKGFKENFPGSYEISAPEPDADVDALVADIEKAKPKVVVIIGASAAKMLHKRLGSVPIIYCMLPENLQKKYGHAATTGVLMQPTPEAQLRSYHGLLPAMKRVGIIYNKGQSEKFVIEARQAAKSMGLSLVEETIDSQKEVMQALKDIVEKADGLWLIRDRKVVNLQFFKLSLQVQAERKIPILVYSDKFVSKGALCSYSASYYDQGHQAAQISRKLMGGTPVQEIPPQPPLGTLVINKTAAKRIGLTLTPQLLKRKDVRAVD